MSRFLPLSFTSLNCQFMSIFVIILIISEHVCFEVWWIANRRSGYVIWNIAHEAYAGSLFVHLGCITIDLVAIEMDIDSFVLLYILVAASADLI